MAQSCLLIFDKDLNVSIVKYFTELNEITTSQILFRIDYSSGVFVILLL
jgi:hypothetical protein